MIHCYIKNGPYSGFRFTVTQDTGVAPSKIEVPYPFPFPAEPERWMRYRLRDEDLVEGEANYLFEREFKFRGPSKLNFVFNPEADWRLVCKSWWPEMQAEQHRLRSREQSWWDKWLTSNPGMRGTSAAIKAVAAKMRELGLAPKPFDDGLAALRAQLGGAQTQMGNCYEFTSEGGIRKSWARRHEDAWQDEIDEFKHLDSDYKEHWSKWLKKQRKIWKKEDEERAEWALQICRFCGDVVPSRLCVPHECEKFCESIQELEESGHSLQIVARW